MSTPPHPGKLLFVGWDAADWKVIHPLVDAGKMPALQSLVERGVIGNLATLRPILSPMLWTSIATGKYAHKHGVHGFTEVNPATGIVEPVSSRTRRTKAFWNILSQSGYRTHVIGWWPSHPAEPINGVMVSDFFHKAPRRPRVPWAMRPGTVHPERLAGPLKKLRVHPREIAGPQVMPFIPKASKIDQEKDRRPEMLAKITAECSTIHAAATAVMQLEPWDLMAVYYDAIDHYSHGFMRYHPPRQEWISKKDFEIYGGVIEGAYRFHDAMLSVLLRLAGPDTTVMLVSDHGFHPDHLRPAVIPDEPAGPAAEHRPFGIFVMAGPGIRRDERLTGASLLDIAPTVLTHFGVAVGADMDGRPLLQAWEQSPPAESVPSWDSIPGASGQLPPRQNLTPEEARAGLRQLIELGYIEDPGPNREMAAWRTEREAAYNLAQALVHARRPAEAMPIYEELAVVEPDEVRFLFQLAHTYQQLERIPEFRDTIHALLETRVRLAAEAREEIEKKGWHKEKPKDLNPGEQRRLQTLRQRAVLNPFLPDYLLGLVAVAAADFPAARKHLEKAALANPRLPDLHVQIGNVFLKLGDPAKAATAFRKALARDPDCASARYGLARAFLRGKRFVEAAAEALAAVGVQYHFPGAHYVIGVCFNRLGHPPRAAQAFEIAAAQNPGFREAHKRLAALYEHHLNDPAKAARHRELAEARPALHHPAPEAPNVPPPPDPSPDRPERPHDWPSDPAQAIIVVSGMPRSGTSMMMQMLAAGGVAILSDGARAADASNPKGYLEFDKVKGIARDTAWLKDARGKAVKIVAPLLPFLPPGPRYEIIFMDRDAVEIEKSQRAMLGRLARNTAGTRTNPAGFEASAIARQAAEITAQLAMRSDIRWLRVPHHQCLTAPLDAARRIAGFLTAAADPARMAAAVDASLHRERV